MPFTAHDLRYHAEQTYATLYAHLNWHAQRSLGEFKHDQVEVDLVVGHVVEQLLRLGLLGGGDRTSLTVLDGLSNAQFYAFLNRSIRNKAIDRLRRRRLLMTYATDFEGTEGTETEEDILNEATENLGGAPPFPPPEHAVLARFLQSKVRYRNLLCIAVPALHFRALSFVKKKTGKVVILPLYSAIAPLQRGRHYSSETIQERLKAALEHRLKCARENLERRGRPIQRPSP